MNTSKNPDFYEAVLLAEYALKTALVQLSVLDQHAIKGLQSVPDYQRDIAQLMQGMENANCSLKQARQTARDLVNKLQRMEMQS